MCRPGSCRTLSLRSRAWVTCSATPGFPPPSRTPTCRPTRSTHADDALDELELTIRTSGAPANFTESRLRFDAPWAHLKVLTADSLAAYIGSANVTAAGLAGQNLELGVLVRGSGVAVVERILDMYWEG